MLDIFPITDRDVAIRDSYFPTGGENMYPSASEKDVSQNVNGVERRAEFDGDLPLTAAAGQRVEAVESLTQRPHPLVIVMAELQAVQCGYCPPGNLMSTKSLLDSISRRRWRPPRLLTAIFAAVSGPTSYGRSFVRPKSWTRTGQ